MIWKEFYTYTATFTSLAAGTGVAFTDFEIKIDTDADFEFVKTIYQPTQARARVRYRDDTNARFLMKGQPDLRLIGGTSLYTMAPGNPTPPGFVPFIWPSPYIIPAATTFTVSAADFLGLSYTLYITFHGSKVRPGPAPYDRKTLGQPEYRAKMPYVYQVNSAAGGTISVAANSTVSATIPTDIDSSFLVYKITGSRTGSCLVTIKDSRDRQWMDTAVPFDNLVGNGNFPNILPSPRFIKRGSVISVSVQDLSGAANTVELNFEGVKLYE